MIINSCGDCGVVEGKLHQEECDQEICPYCKRQLLSCPKHNWNNIKQEDREPYFCNGIFICQRCGKLMPKFFMVSNEEWKKICGKTYDEKEVLCKKCILFIKNKRRKNNGKQR